MPIKNGRQFFDSRLWHILCLLAACVILWSDSLTPLGFDHGSLYMILLILVAFTCHERFLKIITTLAVLFTCLGIFTSPAGIEPGYALLNRMITIFELCLLCGLSLLIKGQQEKYLHTNQALNHSQSIIRQQRELLEIATSTARMGGWSATLPDQQVNWSDYVCHVHGVLPGQAPRLDASFAFYAPEWRAIMQQAMQTCAVDGLPFEQEAELLRADGSRIWVRTSGQAIRDEISGDIIRIQGSLQDISADKANQSILIQLRHHFQQLADAVPQAIWTAGPEGAVDYVNKALLDYCGDKHEQLLGEGWLAHVHPDDTSTVLQTWQQTLTSLQFCSMEFRIRRADGAYRWHVVQAHPIKDDNGALIKWCGSAVDVHETRMLAERQINILESITDAFMTLDGDWRFTYVNKEAERLLQHAREDLLGYNMWELFPAADNFRQHYHRAIAEQTTVSFEEYYVRTSKWFDVRATPAEEGLVIYFRDVTGIRQQTEEMRQGRERFEILAKATTDAVWDWNLVTDQLWWNDSMLTLFGYSPAEIESDSSSWTSHLHPDDKPQVLDSIHQTLAGETSDWRHEYRFCRKDGTYALVLDKGYIIRNQEGKAVRMIGGMVDTTETRLLQERLAQAQRLEALGQLTGGVAHDFNNLLTVIMGNAELLLEQLPRDRKQYELVDLINQAALRAGQLTRHLLAFARKQPLVPEVTDIKKLINGTESLLRRTLMENYEIELVHAGGLWSALVDTAQLESALLNLCLNARDAMPGGGLLTIETSNAFLDQHYADQHDEVQPGQYVMIGVSDSGCGMSTETLMHVFDPFFTTKEPGKGTGLGLSMVYGFVKQSKGHIKIYTEVGQGTTVRMYLPKTTEVRTPGAAQVTLALRGGNGVILLVEDDALVSRYAEQLLVDMGYQVLTAANGPEALAILQQTPGIKLLFTDVIMPGGMNGRQLADAACKLYPALKVLFTSGYTENAIVHQGRLDPGVNLLSKPYQRKDLIGKLKQVLGEDR